MHIENNPFNIVLTQAITPLENQPSGSVQKSNIDDARMQNLKPISVTDLDRMVNNLQDLWLDRKIEISHERYVKLLELGMITGEGFYRNHDGNHCCELPSKTHLTSLADQLAQKIFMDPHLPGESLLIIDAAKKLSRKEGFLDFLVAQFDPKFGELAKTKNYAYSLCQALKTYGPKSLESAYQICNDTRTILQFGSSDKLDEALVGIEVTKGPISQGTHILTRLMYASAPSSLAETGLAACGGSCLAMTASAAFYGMLGISEFAWGVAISAFLLYTPISETLKRFVNFNSIAWDVTRLSSVTEDQRAEIK